MSRAPAKVGMAPPHPGAFIPEEILDELGLTMSEAAKVVDDVIGFLSASADQKSTATVRTQSSARS